MKAHWADEWWIIGAYGVGCWDVNVQVFGSGWGLQMQSLAVYCRCTQEQLSRFSRWIRIRSGSLAMVGRPWQMDRSKFGFRSSLKFCSEAEVFGGGLGTPKQITVEILGSICPHFLRRIGICSGLSAHFGYGRKALVDESQIVWVQQLVEDMFGGQCLGL